MTGHTSEGDAYRDDRAHVFHSWSAQRALDPVVVTGGLGSTFWDVEGTRYLDFSSQLVNLNLGHQHPKVVAAIQSRSQGCSRARSLPATRADGVPRIRVSSASVVTDSKPGPIGPPGAPG